MKVVVTGGAGYIGSHTCMELLAAGHEVFAIDNLCNGSLESIERVRTLSNRSLGFAEVDIRDGEDLGPVFDEFRPDAVIHFAGLKAVGESVAEPLRYYDVNVHGSVSLLNAMDRASCANIVFSSSATVYGDPEYLPYDEAHPTRPVNPYGRTKLMVEDILRDWAAADPARRATALRYFNPVGAHVSGKIGEDPLGVLTRRHLSPVPTDNCEWRAHRPSGEGICLPQRRRRLVQSSVATAVAMAWAITCASHGHVRRPH